MRANWLARLWPLWTLALLAAGCNGPPLSILPATLPNAVEDTSYSETLSTDGQGVLHWEIADGALPPGMTLGEDSGVISGRPTQAGTFDFAVVANNESPPLRTGEESYSLVVLERLTVDFTLPAARVSEAYEGTPVIAGGVPPYTAKIVGLPAGLDYDPATGKITGTPLNDNAGLRLDLSVTDSGEPQQLATARTYLAIHPIGVTIVTTTLADAAAGVAYSTSVEAVDGREPFDWQVTAGVLPAGLRLNRATGVISGTPTGVAETETFTISVTDSDSPAATDAREFKLIVPLVVGTTALPDATIGTPYSTALLAGHGLPPYSWALASGQLPEGLVLDATMGEISGTPVAAAASQTFTVRVTDSDEPALAAEEELTIHVGP